jgi:hypothetical protein
MRKHAENCFVIGSGGGELGTSESPVS